MSTSPLLRILLGVVAAIAGMAAVFAVFLFLNPLSLHQANQLRWVPVLACAVGLYAAGRLNAATRAWGLPALLVSFVVFDLFDYLYLPFVGVLLAVAALVLVASRPAVPSRVKAGAWVAVAGIVGGHLLAQPLVIEHEGFGRNADGVLENATVLWDFSGPPGPGFPSHGLDDADGGSVDLASVNGTTQFVSFWATWCVPCLRDKPALDRLKADFQDDPAVGFVDISLDEDRARWAAFLADHEPAGRQWIAPDPDVTRRVLGVSALPSHVVLEPDGDRTTFHTLDEAEARLRHLLAPEGARASGDAPPSSP